MAFSVESHPQQEELWQLNHVLTAYGQCEPFALYNYFKPSITFRRSTIPLHSDNWSTERAQSLHLPHLSNPFRPAVSIPLKELRSGSTASRTDFLKLHRTKGILSSPSSSIEYLRACKASSISSTLKYLTLLPLIVSIWISWWRSGLLLSVTSRTMPSMKHGYSSVPSFNRVCDDVSDMVVPVCVLDCWKALMIL